MVAIKTLAASALMVGTLIAAATPANAIVTTFAQYDALGAGANLHWLNSNAPANANGTGGSLFSVASQYSTVAASRDVSFSFLEASLASVSGVTAVFTLNATAASGNPAYLVGSNLVQPGIAGTFSFVSTAPITIGSTLYASGANLLSGSFDLGAITGNRGGDSGSVSASTQNSSLITYTSDFLTFAPGSDLGFELLLSSIFSPIQATPTNTNPTHALRSFRARSTGTFSADLSAPPVDGVPEPAVWGLMIVGFGMVGIQARRRNLNAFAA